MKVILIQLFNAEVSILPVMFSLLNVRGCSSDNKIQNVIINCS
jgi:hypothetical protein